VDLSTGIVLDGTGGTDTLIDIHTVHGTSFDDIFKGSASDDQFWTLGGNDTVDGGAGLDIVTYYRVGLDEVSIAYDKVLDLITVTHNPTDAGAGGYGIDHLKGIEAISFVGLNGLSMTLSKEDISGPFAMPVQIPMSSAPGNV
jgi:hypothetical protein